MKRPLHRFVALLLPLSVLAAAACQFRETPTGGFWLSPDTPAGARILVIGDSLMRQPGLAFAAQLVTTGKDVRVEAVNGSGLISGPVEWKSRAAQLVADYHPTHVLVSFIGNFGPPYPPNYAPPGTEEDAEYWEWIKATMNAIEFVNRYVESARALTAIFAAAGIRTYWVEPVPLPPHYGSPSIADKLWSRFATDLPAAYPGTRLLSARSSVANADGTWLRDKVLCGTTYEIRTAGDGGLHLTSDGAGTYGRALARALSSAEGWAQPAPKCPGMQD
jgi:hypothetical protein